MKDAQGKCSIVQWLRRSRATYPMLSQQSSVKVLAILYSTRAALCITMRGTGGPPGQTVGESKTSNKHDARRQCLREEDLPNSHATGARSGSQGAEPAQMHSGPSGEGAKI